MMFAYKCIMFSHCTACCGYVACAVTIRLRDTPQLTCRYSLSRSDSCPYCTYHIIQGELCSLCHNVSVDCHHGTPIVVNTVSITAPLVGIQIDASTLEQHQQHIECSTDFCQTYCIFKIENLLQRMLWQNQVIHLWYNTALWWFLLSLCMPFLQNHIWWRIHQMWFFAIHLIPDHYLWLFCCISIITHIPCFYMTWQMFEDPWFKNTLVVAVLTRLTLWSALRSSWWLAEELVKISTPSRPIWICGLRKIESV